jgi:hypothetical protein
MSIEEKFTIIAGLLAAFKWVYEYTQKLSWERSRFLLDCLQDFNAKENTKKVQKILDWNLLNIEIAGNEEQIEDQILMQALQTHDIKSSYSNLEYELRGMFDEYFDDLNALVQLQKAGLIDEDRLKMFLSYWFSILNGERKNKSQAFALSVKKYMLFYGYEELYEFIEQNPFNKMVKKLHAIRRNF